MKNQFKKFYVLRSNFLILFGFFAFFSININLNAKEKNNHSLPIKVISVTKESSNNLAPMPVGNIDSSSKQVNVNRNPFKDISEKNLSNINDLNLIIQFKGIAQSKNKLVAIIKTEEDENFYQVGDILNNGFKVTSISLDDVTVDISNGFKKFRLSLINSL
tara:strand:+ start:2954 stop:3436 length:483 start_codon:yes stop_codon:yes gene_type:complete